MFDSFGSWSYFILVCSGSLHSGASFWYFFHFWDIMGLQLLCIIFDYDHFHFWHFSCFWVQLLKIFLVFLLFFWGGGSPVGVPLGILSLLSPLEFLHGWFNALIGIIFNFVFFLVHLLDFLLVCLLYWHPRKYCWGVWSSKTYLLCISMPLCVNFLVCLVG